jgi:hypothetical protein
MGRYFTQNFQTHGFEIILCTSVTLQFDCLFLQKIWQQNNINVEWISHQFPNRIIQGGIWKIVHELFSKAIQIRHFCSFDTGNADQDLPFQL